MMPLDNFFQSVAEILGRPQSSYDPALEERQMLDRNDSLLC